MSRDLDWGIPVPVEGAEGKVLYVWFDAPIGYISNTKELLPDSWETWWKDPETKMVHFIGKDNIVFHCIVFPSMLKAEGSYNLPENVPANEFLNLEGDQDLYFPQLGGLVERVSGGYAGQARRVALCLDGQRTGDKG